MSVPLPLPLPEPEDVLDLTPAMIVPAESIVSPPTAQLSADVLGELARAILAHRRD